MYQGWIRSRKIIGAKGLVAAGLGLALAGPAQGAVTFTFNYLDALGVGFNANGQTGIDRKAGLDQATGYLSGLLVNYDATINLDVDGSQTDDSTLASAGSAFNSSYPGEGFASLGDVQLKILGGNAADPAPGTADGSINWNFEDFNWEPLSDFQAGELDLISTAIHELAHALGFASDIAQNGESGWGDPAGDPSAWSPFDDFVTDSTSVPLISDTTFALDGTRWSAASVGGTGTAGLLFDGPNANAANGGNPVPLYSPTTWEDGSSGSHLDTDFFTGANAQMMNHAAAVAEGLDIREFSMIEFGILKDIGYASILMPGIPEPASVALLAMAGLSFLSRRRAAQG